MSAVVSAEQAGVYRQFAHKIRIQNRPGETDRLSERPRHEKSRRYLDSDAEPTLIELREGDPVDVPFLLAIGGIAPYRPPTKASKAKGAAHGEDPE